MQLIGIAGYKRGGKDSALKFLFGHIAVKNGLLEKFDIDEQGNLLVNYHNSTTKETGMGIFDIDSKHPSIVGFLAQRFWPIVKQYHFADILKEICMTMYGLTPEQLSGTSEQRDSLTQYTWEQLNKVLPKKIKKTGFLTSREFIQNIADVFRHVNDRCFTDPTMKAIEFDQSQYALVGDVRRIQEVEAIKQAGGKVIYLTRKIDVNDKHSTENEFTNYDKSNFDAVIDNQNMSIVDKNIELLRIVNEWNLF